MIYLCSVYSHGEGKTDPEVRQRRYELVRDFVAKNIERPLYSPIVHCHEMATLYEMPKDDEFWKQKDRNIIRRCDAVWILDIPNEEGWLWDQSEGIRDEATFAMECGIPVQRVVYYTPDREIPENVVKILEGEEDTDDESN